MFPARVQTAPRVSARYRLEVLPEKQEVVVRAIIGRYWVKVVRVLVACAIVVSASVLPASATARTRAVHNSRPAPYLVGMRSYTFVDASRPTAANGSFPGAPTRTLRTLLLYPAVGDPNGPAVANAKPIRRRDGFPLIVFSHGFGASGPAYEFLLEQFVREGYVIAAPTFPLSSAGAPGGSDGGDYINQPGDVSFVLTSVLKVARMDPSLRRTIDRHDVGAFGHSLGAITTLGVATNSCCVDHRIRAAVSFSGIELPFPGGSFFATANAAADAGSRRRRRDSSLCWKRVRVRASARPEGLPHPPRRWARAVPSAVARPGRAVHHRLPRRFPQARPSRAPATGERRECAGRRIATGRPAQASMTPAASLREPRMTVQAERSAVPPYSGRTVAVRSAAIAQ